MTTELALATAHDPDEERWISGLHLVGEWLMEQSGNTRSAYASGIGWPYRPDGSWRGYNTTRNGQAWLNWCHHAGVHLLDAERVHILAWIDDFTASRSKNGAPRPARMYDAGREPAEVGASERRPRTRRVTQPLDGRPELYRPDDRVRMRRSSRCSGGVTVATARTCLRANKVRIKMGMYLCGTGGFEVHEDEVESATRCAQPADPRLGGICRGLLRRTRVAVRTRAG